MPQIPDHYDPSAIASDATGGSVIVEISKDAIETAEKRFFTASEDVSVVALRQRIQSLARVIDMLVPPGRNKALALTALEDVQMRANRGIFAPEDLR